jgi:hypothetical protein
LRIGSNWVEFSFFLVELLLKVGIRSLVLIISLVLKYPNPNCIFDAHKVSM